MLVLRVADTSSPAASCIRLPLTCQAPGPIGLGRTHELAATLVLAVRIEGRSRGVCGHSPPPCPHLQWSRGMRQARISSQSACRNRLPGGPCSSGHLRGQTKGVRVLVEYFNNFLAGHVPMLLPRMREHLPDHCKAAGLIHHQKKVRNRFTATRMKPIDLQTRPNKACRTCLSW